MNQMRLPPKGYRRSKIPRRSGKKVTSSRRILFTRGRVKHILEIEFEDGSLLGSGDGSADTLGDFSHDGVDNKIHATGDPDAVLEGEEVLGKAGGVDPRDVTSQLT
jgi:hypothetical protein